MNRIEQLIAILIAPFQVLENTLQDLLTQRAVDTAIGAQLDRLGVIVGQPRLGLLDDAYRIYIRARIATNRSNGTTEDLIKIAKLIINDPTALITARNEGTATVRVTIGVITVTDALGDILFTFLSQAVSAGVRIVVEWSESTPSATFTFDAGPGFDTGHLASDLG